ncbi:MAG: DUF1572 family protein [Betaproteobacteria bacterium]
MTVADRDLRSLFVEFSRRKLVDQYWPRLPIAVESLADDQVWWRPNEASNSIGNLILHLNGNVRQWPVASFERLQDGRDRPAEFGERRAIPARVLLDELATTTGQAYGLGARGGKLGARGPL